MSKKVIIFILFVLFGCVPIQKPTQSIINYTDNSQTIQVVGDSNQMSATTDVQAQQTSTPKQTTENTTKDSMWIFWLIIVCALVGGGYLYYWYRKKRII